MGLQRNAEIAAVFAEIAFFSELADANPFKIRALQNGARAIEETGEDVATLARENRLGEIAGVGKGLAAAIKEFLNTGKVAELEALRREFPPGLLELKSVPGLGPKRIKKLYDELGIASLTELEYALNENRLVELKGFGEKMQKKFQAALADLKASRGRILLPRALEAGEAVLAALAKVSGVKRAEETGELRRRLETVGSLDFVLETGAEAPKPKTIASALAKLEITPTDSDAADPELCFTGVNADGIAVRVFAAPAAKFAALEIELTGSSEFLAALNEKNGATAKFKTEAEYFAAHDLPWIPPEAREGDPREIARNIASLVEEKDIRGIFHAHTTASDGTATLAEMAARCQELGFEYLGVSDHSQSAGYAGGLKADAILRQREEVERLNAKFTGFRIFHGIESDIKNDGALDYPEKVLKEFDFVIASLHGGFQMPRAEMTERVCTALANPFTTWLGHATARLLLGRRGVDLDMDAVLAAAAKHRKSIELNANPYRLDLDWRHLRQARQKKIPIGIFPDAHSTGGIADFRWGVIMARKGGLTKADVVNTKPLKEMEAWLARRL